MAVKLKRICYVYFLICLTMTGSAYASEEIIVSAAASLTLVMTQISQAFETQHPGVHVMCNFASSGSLVTQMDNGAPVDVFASASIGHMERAESRDLIDSRTRKIFAANHLVLIVPAQSNSFISDIQDLRNPEFKKIALGHPESVPAGGYAKGFLEKNGLWETLYDRLVYANSVRQVMDYVRRGETDAGFVYATDIQGAKDKVKVKLAADKSLDILYPIAVTRMSRHPLSARKFCEFVNGPAGRKILSAHGFANPE